MELSRWKLDSSSRNRRIEEKYEIKISDITKHSWGMHDFIVVDPSGVLWRIAQNIKEKETTQPVEVQKPLNSGWKITQSGEAWERNTDHGVFTMREHHTSKRRNSSEFTRRVLSMAFGHSSMTRCWSKKIPDIGKNMHRQHILDKWSKHQGGIIISIGIRQ